ncbi:EamA family transporter [uncultured Thalassospira sp.]|uniref:DMT family transporter n=1 Tax=uncultured Thalassospira sp. TaxID=404382 RepID=UPI0030DA82E8|tara:strand:+ start:8803 stop:9717 length:915 start_codon:yes stop_codon:yes gene_type:complete
MQTPKTTLAAEFLLLAVLALLWGSSYIFIKIALVDFPPVTLIAARVGIAALFLTGIVMWRGDKFPRDGKTWRMLLIQAIFNSIGAWTVLAWGQQYVDSGLASVLNSTSPVFLFFITLFVTRHETVNTAKLIGSMIGVAGVILIVGPGVLHGLGTDIKGQGAVLLGALLYACGAIYGKRFSGLSATVTAAGTMIWASICLIPASLLIDQPWALTPSPRAIIAVLVLSVFCTGVALMIYFRLVRTLGSMGVASQSYLRAGVGVALGVLLLGEKIDSLTLAGICCALIGVAAINWPRKTRPIATKHA